MVVFNPCISQMRKLHGRRSCRLKVRVSGGIGTRAQAPVPGPGLFLLTPFLCDGSAISVQVPEVGCIE